MAAPYPSETRLNDSLYSLYKPPDPNAEFVFFHGTDREACEEMHIKAWMTSSGICWPAEWLHNELGLEGAHIFTVNYDSSLIKTDDAGVLSMHNLTENLAHDLISCGDIGQKGLPVVMIGYDLGGLVIKALCIYLESEPVDAKRRRMFENFLRNVRGVFYFSTPHQGAEIADGSDLDGELAEYVKLLNARSAQMNGKFQRIRKERNWKTGGLGHLLKDPKGPIHLPEATMRYDTDFFMMAQETWEAINKPNSPESSSFQFFLSCVQSFIEDHLQEEPNEEYEKFISKKVGLRSGVDQVVSLFSSLEKAEGNVSGVMLDGMGGIGKSTLGDAVFLKLSKKFDPDCRCSVDREAIVNPARPLSKLQKSILGSLMSGSKPDADRKKILKALKKCYRDANRRLLIFIDNIENAHDLDDIFPDDEIDLPPGSCILIASRSLEMCTKLRALNVRKTCSYAVQELDEDSAQKLFLRNAVIESNGIQQDEKWRHVRNILDACSGLPPWNELKLLYGHTLGILEQKALISKDKRLEYAPSIRFPTVKVHALFVALGEKEGKALGSHLKLNVKQDCEAEFGRGFSFPFDFPLSHTYRPTVSSNRNGDDNELEGRCDVLILDGNPSSFSYPDSDMSTQLKLTEGQAQFPLFGLRKFMRTLRILILRDVIVCGMFGRETVPENLECFICSNSNVPFQGGDLTSMKKLKHLEIMTAVDTNDTYKFPDGVRKVRFENKNVEGMMFGAGGAFDSLKRLEEFGLMSVTSLLLNTPVSQFKALKKVVLRDISGLDNNLPEVLFQMKSLKSLSIQYCEHVSVLPDVNMQNLEHLHLALPALIKLPDSLQTLQSLRSLTLENCQWLRELPAGIGTPRTQRLQLIAISRCPCLKTLPSAFHKTHTMESVLELQLPNNWASEWHYYTTTRDKLDVTLVEDKLAETSMNPLINQLNDYIYELYNPTEGADMDIILVHGLQLDGTDNLHLSTWISGDGGSYHVWPKTWLPQDFPHARILTVAYDSHLYQTTEQGLPNQHNTVENLINCLLLPEMEDELSYRPLVLVGYSFGGILIKNLCLHTFNKIIAYPKPQLKLFLERIRGIYFIGTPHLGMIHEGFGLAIQRNASPLFKNAELLNRTSVRIHDDFDVLRRRYAVEVFSIGESKETRWGSLETVLVPEASARYEEVFVKVQVDHVSLSKPKTEKYLVYGQLKFLIKQAYKGKVKRNQRFSCDVIVKG
ncbi:hypothetical protein R1sor_012243 [Riccia sorocarpa]|uniref:NB-ARC domain-containing protein n=1 Tax=Riccia sorocarpa TaxID=122646 RepID=A0ABD3I5Y5_9MARC